MMKVLRATVVAALLLSLAQVALAQSNGSDSASAVSNQNGDSKRLEAMVQEQQKLMAEQKRQLEELEQEVARLRQVVISQPQAASTNASDSAPKLVHANLKTADVAAAPAIGLASEAMLPQPQEAEQKESPISFRIGGAEFTPGGFMDLTSIFRTTNTGNPGGTNFFAIPYNNTVAGRLTETRFTAQNSRISLKAHEKFGKNDVTAYYEMDFLGNDAANVEVTSNSHTFRQRLYWIDLKRGKWELFGGQTWSWLTPNRVGLSPNPSDIFYGQNIDFNYQVGLTWTRAPEFRVVYHPNENWAMGVALENPEQFGGQGELQFPFAFNATLGVQVDQANNSGTPNLFPDIIPKIGYDREVGGKHFHAEAAGLFTSIKITNLLGPSNTTFTTHSKVGEGLEAAVNLELLKNFHFVASGFYSGGGGRYIFGMGPDAVFLPNAARTDVNISLVHADSGIVGLEAQVTPRTMLFGYYGGAYFQRNVGLDTTPGAKANTLVGFGAPPAFGASNNNRAIQEPTIGWIQTLWKNPQYGALQIITQFSYLTRAPWFVAQDQPKNAHLTMAWVDLRYVVP